MVRLMMKGRLHHSLGVHLEFDSFSGFLVDKVGQRNELAEVHKSKILSSFGAFFCTLIYIYTLKRFCPSCVMYRERIMLEDNNLFCKIVGFYRVNLLEFNLKGCW